MIKTIAVGLGGAAIGGVLGSTVSIFLRWRPAIAVGALLFGGLALWVESQQSDAAPNDQSDRPAGQFPEHDTRNR